MTQSQKSVTLLPRSLNLTPLDFIPCRFVKDASYLKMVQNGNELLARIVTPAEYVTNEMLENTWLETEHSFHVYLPLTVTILRSTGHTRNFVRSSVWKCIDFSTTLYV
jgi:hypothetical protein